MYNNMLYYCYIPMKWIYNLIIYLVGGFKHEFFKMVKTTNQQNCL
jgi:hypothetical protein